MRNGTNVEKLKPTVVQNRMQHNRERKKNNRNAYSFSGTGLIEGKIDWKLHIIFHRIKRKLQQFVVSNRAVFPLDEEKQRVPITYTWRAIENKLKEFFRYSLILAVSFVPQICDSVCRIRVIQLYFSSSFQVGRSLLWSLCNFFFIFVFGTILLGYI